MSTKKKFGIAAVLLWGLLLVVGFLGMGRFASGSGTNYSSALWAGSREGFVKLSAETGAVLLRVPMREESREFGIDEWNGRVWVLTDRTLYSYGFDGTRVLSLSLQGQRNGCQGGRSRSLVVDTLDGSAFVSRDKSIVRFAPDGTVLARVRLLHGAEEMAFDAVHSLLFASACGRVLSFSEAGQYLGAATFGRYSDIRDLASSSGELFVALEDSIVKATHDLTPVLEVRLRDLKAIAADAAGLWAVTDRFLYRLNSSLTVLFRKDLRDDALDLLSDGTGCWVRGRRNLYHFSQSGTLLLSVRATPCGDAEGFALYRDSLAPTVRIVSPTGGAFLNTQSPAIQLSLSDIGSGANLSTVSFQVNGATVSSSCTERSGGALCTLGTSLAEGLEAVAVTVKDFEGNASSPAQVTFTVDVTPPVVTVSSPAGGLITNRAAQSLAGSVSEPGALTVNGEALTLNGSNQFSKAVTLSEGSNTFHIAASDLAGNTAAVDLQATLDTVPPGSPVGNLVTVSRSVDGQATVTGASGSVEANAWVVVTNLRTGESFSVLSGTDGSFSIAIAALAGDALSITVRDAAGNTGSGLSTIVLSPPAAENIPAGSFGDTYRDLVPADATLTSYDTKRFSLVTGLVWDENGNGLSDVTVSVLLHPEYGTVRTGSDGRFSIPVEGGGPLTVAYQKSGFIGAQRQVNVPWNGIAAVETVRMVTADTASTTVTFDGNASTFVTHRSTEVTDSAGRRSCTLVFSGDTHAYSVDASGNTLSELTSVVTRATEFKTPETMPAKLPPSSAFTYCADLTVDGVERVRFSKPVTVWVENFLNFPVGTAVPVGYYDRDKGAWVPSDSGVVVRLLDTDGDGIADAVDSTGDGQPDDIDRDGSTSNEAAGLGDPAKYPPGTTFWRFTAMHFSPWDSNWGYTPPSDAAYADTPVVTTDQQMEEPQTCPLQINSYVEERSRILHEDLEIPGTGMTLHYATDRVSGFKQLITVPASGASVPASLRRIVVRVEVAGRTFEEELNPLPNQQKTFEWDGLDQLGRRMKGSVTAHIGVGYVYGGVYQTTSRFGYNGGGTIEGSRTRQEVTLWRTSDSVIRCAAPGEEVAVGEGWSLSVHHVLNPADPATLLKGDGTVVKTSAGIIRTVAGTGAAGYGGDGGPGTQAMLSWPHRATIHPSGDLYIAEPGNNRIRKLDTNGIITTVAGKGAEAHDGDGGPAVQANIASAQKVAFDPAGNMYIAETHAGCVRKVDVNGIISTVACGLDWPDTVAADAAGNVYIGEQYASRIRKVDLAGGMNVILSGGFGNITDLAADPAGNLFIADRYGCRVMKLDTSGNLTRFAGGNGYGYSGDGGPASSARMSNIFAISTNDSGELFIGDFGNGAVRKVDKFGNISTVAGTGSWGSGSDGGLATRTSLPGAFGVAVDPAGNIYVVEPDAQRVRKISPQASFTRGVGAGELAFVEENGLGHIFTSAGLHEKTIDLATGVVLASFGYNQANQLISMTDRFGAVTQIERGGNGVATAVVSPDGLTTVLSVDANGRLASVRYPDGGTRLLEYSSDGLLLAKVDGNGNRFLHDFDLTGRLLRERDQEGGSWTFSRSVQTSGKVLTERSTAEGNVTTYLDLTASTGVFTSTITDPAGGQTVFSRSADGLRVEKSLSCGKFMAMDYGSDPEYKFTFIKAAAETLPSGLTKSSSFGRAYADSNGDGARDRITATQTVNGNVSTVVDNTLTGTRTATSPAGRTATFTYDPANLLTTGIAVPGFYESLFSYDARGRVISLATGTRQWTTAYDAAGNVSSVTDPENRTTTYHHDPVGRLSGVTRPDGTGLGFTYDLNGNVTVLNTPSLVAHAFGYNRVNLGSSYAAPLSGSYASTYDRERNLKKVTFPSGKEIENIYDKGLLKETVTPEGTIEYSYPCSSKLGSATSGMESVAYGYDGPLVTSETFSGTLAATLGYAYNNDFRPSRLTYAGGTVNYAYDADGLLTQSGAFAIGRNASSGLPVSISGGTLSISRSFNGYGESTGETFRANGLDSHSRTVSRSDSGRILSRTETVNGSSVETTWTYDELGRLLTASRNGTLVEEYRYDANGNRTYERNLLRGIERNSTFSEEDHLLISGDATHEYDADGFLTTVTRGAQVTRYSYSSRGELLSVTLPSGDIIEYVYDPFGRRIAKKVNGSVTEKYLRQGMTRLLAVYDGSDNLLMRFEYADGRMPVAMTKGGATYYLACDQVGSPVAVFDASGNIVKELDRDSFGNLLSDSDPTFTLPFGFAGGLYDPDTGLVRFGHRDYDPDTGRWTAKDPIGFKGGDANLYGYVLNDPVNLVDPNGKLAIGAAVGIVVGGISGGIGSYLSGGNLGDILAGTLIGAGTGLLIGSLDPSEGIGTLAMIGAGSGAVGDLIGQILAQRHNACININFGEAMGASIGGALSAAGVPILAAAMEGGASELAIQIVANSLGGYFQVGLTEIGRLAGGGELRTTPVEMTLW